MLVMIHLIDPVTVVVKSDKNKLENECNKFNEKQVNFVHFSFELALATFFFKAFY